MEDSNIFAFVLVLFVLVLLYKAVRIVPQGQEQTVERFGRFTHTISPGLTLIMPLIDRIGAVVDMREQVLDVPSQDVITKDNALVRVDGVVFYQVLDAAKASYEVNNMRNAILNLVMTNLRTVMGSMALDELLSERDDINQRLLGVVDGATASWGVKVTRVEIKDISPPRDLVDTMARQMKAEREKRAQILEAEGLKQAQILKAEGLKQAQILKADGDKQAAILSAEGRKEAAFRDAEARERAAQAEAKATEDVSLAIGKGNLHAVNYFLGLKYVEALQTMINSPNQKLLMLPIEASNLLGSLTGIAEIAKEAFQKKETSDRKPTV